MVCVFVFLYLYVYIYVLYSGKALKSFYGNQGISSQTIILPLMAYVEMS